MSTSPDPIPSAPAGASPATAAQVLPYAALRRPKSPMDLLRKRQRGVLILALMQIALFITWIATEIASHYSRQRVLLEFLSGLSMVMLGIVLIALIIELAVLALSLDEGLSSVLIACLSLIPVLNLFLAIILYNQTSTVIREWEARQQSRKMPLP